MKNIIAFLFGWIIAAVLLIPHAQAAVAVTPSISGYSAATGRYASPAAGFAMTAANDGYIAQSVLNVGGKAVTLPATLRMASNAGRYAIEGMRLNPLLLAGTLALPWLIDYGIEWANGHWEVKDSGIHGTTGTWSGSYLDQPCSGDLYSCLVLVVSTIRTMNGCTYQTGGYCPSNPEQLDCVKANPTQWTCGGYAGGGLTYTAGDMAQGSRPATDDDFAGLPDPLSAVVPELPYAPYLPQGVPVNKPEYAPADLPVGDPYTRPDGSTAQPRVKISPSGDGQVTVAPYDQPLTDPQGQPVPNPQPEPTPDPQQSECEKHPNTIGCSEYGTAPAPDAIPVTVIPVDTAVVSLGGAGTCPADVTTSHFGITWSYKPVCDFADAIRPLVIGFAWLAFAYIVVGAIRT